MSWNEIRRPAGIMLNYIQQRQVEMAGEKSTAATVTVAQVLGHSEGNTPLSKSNINGEQDEIENLDKFRALSSVEMMDHLSRDLELWQQTIKDLEK